jgi:hypothetical protein
MGAGTIIDRIVAGAQQTIAFERDNLADKTMKEMGVCREKYPPGDDRCRRDSLR